jgi:hypothetical protein
MGTNKLFDEKIDRWVELRSNLRQSFDFLNNASSGCFKNLKEPLGIMKELTIIFWVVI